VLKVLFVYLRKNTFIYSHVLNVYIFTANFENLFVYHLKTTFYVPPRITCCLFLWTTSTYSPFQHIAKDYICHTHCLLIIMAKTHRTNPHSEEPTRRSNRTAGKTPASVELPARKPAATRGERKGPPEGIASKDTAASPSGDSEFSGERKGPPEGIVPAPPPEEATIVPRLPTLWEWTPPSDVSDVAVPPVQPFFRPIVPMPTLVGIDFAAAQHDVIADRDVAAAPRRTSRRYPGSKNNGKYYKLGGGDDNGGKDYDIMVAGEEEGKHDGGGENYDDGYARSVESVDDDRDGDFVPTKGFEYSDDDDDFDHLLDDDDINEEDKRIEKMDSKSRIPTGRRRGNLIQGGPVAPNYKLMSASEASDARIEYQSLRKTYRDGIRRERLRGNKGESFNEADYTGDLTPTLRPMELVLSTRLQLGHTFPESGLVKLRVAEEANHRGIYFSVHKSDAMRLICKGKDSFFIQASNSDMGWTITKCEVLVQQGDQPLREIFLYSSFQLGYGMDHHKMRSACATRGSTIA
jgi:hypothetical protein